MTFVDLDDARAYARWAGARLPTEDEWQLAAPSAAGRRGATAQVWNWTESEHSDGRTRYVQLKGGSAYLADGSEWYFDGGPQPPEVTAKLLLPGLGLARSSMIGFRLAWDQEHRHEPQDRSPASGWSTSPRCSPDRWPRRSSATSAPT